MISVAYLGPPGTYTESAALSYLKLHNLLESESQLCPYPTITQTLKAVAQDGLSFAVVPVENSIQGSVTMTLDGVWQWDQLQIQEALVLPIHHALITKAQDISQIQTVYSHPQSLAQCQQWLEKFLPKVQLIPANSNTEKLTTVAEDYTLAAIASQRAAEIYGLPILAFPINDHPNNCTRFWVLARTAPTTTGGHTSLAFSFKQNTPGALVQPLSIFANRGINLSRIESRPSRRSLGDYFFFADVEAAVEDARMQEAIAALATLAETLKIFGSYAIVHP
jgi:prephenate dehydratase